MSIPDNWQVAGSYFEACNCDAICPCRTVNGRFGGRSTHGICQFALSWQIVEGRADNLALNDLAVVMAGWYDDDTPEGKWSIVLYIDDRALDDQYVALAHIFLGRAGGTPFANYSQAIGNVHHVRRASITLSHEPQRWRIRAAHYVNVSAVKQVNDASTTVACGIPGNDRPGQEVVADVLTVDDDPLAWDLRERCGFATSFSYSSSA